MTMRAVVCLAVVLLLCGCDRLLKGFGPQPKMGPPTAGSLPAQRAVAQPPIQTAAAAPPSAALPPTQDVSAQERSESTPASTDAALLLYEDSFSDAEGSIRRKIDGQPQPSEGPLGRKTVYTFQAKAEEGKITLRIFEDNQTAGPDGKPGVLAVSWEEIPKKLDWSGFVYLGGATQIGKMTLPKLKEARSVDDLRGLRLKFRYRGVNAKADTPVKIPISCRFEPVMEDSYNRRIDFGVLMATDQWQTLDVSLADGKNLDAFLKMLAGDNPPGFKIVWGQSHPIVQYRAGDTLLIDDISVTSGGQAKSEEAAE